MAVQQPRPWPPELTSHADQRWEQRSFEIECDPWTAWVDAEPVELPEPWGSQGDEARYHVDAGVLLCRRDVAITTVYDIWGPDAHPRVQHAVANQLGLEGKR